MIPLAYNTLVVLAGCGLLGLAAGTVGCFALLRGRALVADAVGHAALPGVALGALAAAALGLEARALAPLLLGAAATGVLGVLAMQALARTGRVREDAAIAVVLSAFYAAGVALLSVVQATPGAAQAGLSRFILGQAAALRAADAWLAGAIALGCVAACLALFRPLAVTCFDAEFARMKGLPVGTLDLVLLGLVVTVCVAGLQAVGLVLVVALLVLPPAAARLWAGRLPGMLALSALFGAGCGVAGAAASALWPDLPTGAAVVLAGAALLLASVLLGPEAPLAAAARRRGRRRRAAWTP
jgi:manganese/zinc/iron transport system permease protein